MKACMSPVESTYKACIEPCKAKVGRDEILKCASPCAAAGRSGGQACRDAYDKCASSCK